MSFFAFFFVLFFLVKKRTKKDKAQEKLPRACRRASSLLSRATALSLSQNSLSIVLSQLRKLVRGPEGKAGVRWKEGEELFSLLIFFCPFLHQGKKGQNYFTMIKKPNNNKLILADMRLMLCLI
ncbi:MAG: hypothetical protein QM734_07095 [Cyclobacteriaceae bacterium]